MFQLLTPVCVTAFENLIRFFHQSHNTVHFGGLFTLKQWIFSSLKHDTVPRENKLYCFYVKNPPKRIALWDRENSQFPVFFYVFQLAMPYAFWLITNRQLNFA